MAIQISQILRRSAPSCLLFALLACGDETSSVMDEPHDAGQALSTQSFVEGRDACDPETSLTYTNFGDPLLGQWCTSCHSSALPEGMRQGAPIAMNFDSYDGIVSNIDRIYARAADDNATMPPVGGPDAATRRLLGDWLACGAPGIPEDLQPGEMVDTSDGSGDMVGMTMDGSSATITPGLADDQCPEIMVQGRSLAGCCTEGSCAGVAAMSGMTVIPEGMIACVRFDNGADATPCGE